MKWCAIHENAAGAGDIATHIDGHLDPREVARIDHEKQEVWLYLLTDEPAGPFPLRNYRYSRRED